MVIVDSSKSLVTKKIQATTVAIRITMITIPTITTASTAGRKENTQLELLDINFAKIVKPAVLPQLTAGCKGCH